MMRLHFECPTTRMEEFYPVGLSLCISGSIADPIQAQLPTEGYSVPNSPSPRMKENPVQGALTEAQPANLNMILQTPSLTTLFTLLAHSFTIFTHSCFPHTYNVQPRILWYYKLIQTLYYRVYYNITVY